MGAGWFYYERVSTSGRGREAGRETTRPGEGRVVGMVLCKWVGSM